ncbi:sulfotransferase family 2 domain-containing protein [Synechococcus sp. CCY9201]|uniref:sulfotransferase family 2 domain-containing protein n=1 Tax=Synechococcus sp. CCY9201 TaxID=174697 RepID=UPI002B1FE6C0|nr:sulfotransferase family 2 domain-containing protein [Synechococcus sp. CCY9201]MEA5474687.1 sulfotransferase family 2 domain-containing protein [Synechococcus sp. CCY9201]
MAAFKPAQADLVSMGLFAAEAGLAEWVTAPLLRSIGVNPWSDFQKVSRLIFLHIAKCAGTSLLRQLPSGIVGAHNNHFAAIQYWAHDAKAFRDSFKFAIVRCPVERFVSAWKYALFSGRCGPLGNRVPSSVNQTARLLAQPLGRRYLWSAPHFRPQLSFLLAPVFNSSSEEKNQPWNQLGISVDFVARLDKFAEALEILSNHLNMRLSPDLVVNSTGSFRYRPNCLFDSNLSDESRELILRFYQADYEFFQSL